jgi:hypothetical protein
MQRITVVYSVQCLVLFCLVGSWGGGALCRERVRVLVCEVCDGYLLGRMTRAQRASLG